MGSPNFAEIAARVGAGTDEVRSCLLVSPDGLTLACFPDELEPHARTAWGRMAASGDPEPERGFLVVGEEIWAFTRRGGYGALAVAARSLRPGLLLDDLDAALREMHQERADAAPAREPAARPTSEPVRRPRTGMHPERRPVRRSSERPPGPSVRRLVPEDLEDAEAVPEGRRVPRPRAPREAPPPPPAPEPLAPVNVPVDTVELTREFGGLLDGPGSR